MHDNTIDNCTPHHQIIHIHSINGSRNHWPFVWSWTKSILYSIHSHPTQYLCNTITLIYLKMRSLSFLFYFTRKVPTTQRDFLFISNKLIENREETRRRKWVTHTHTVVLWEKRSTCINHLDLAGMICLLVVFLLQFHAYLWRHVLINSDE